jgi:hypothetical protein
MLIFLFEKHSLLNSHHMKMIDDDVYLKKITTSGFTKSYSTQSSRPAKGIIKRVNIQIIKRVNIQQLMMSTRRE